MTRVLLVDDHTLMRKGLKALLEKEPSLEICAEAADGMDAVRLARELKPDVVVMDLGLPRLNGVEATRQILEEDPACRVIALSMHQDKRYVTRALRAGACGYLLKDAALEDLVKAIEAVGQGQTFLSPEVAGLVIDELKNQPEGQEQVDSLLTGREREVLQLLAEGQSTKDIAKLLHISPKTVETHRRKLMDKLDLHSVADLTRYAIREGLVDFES